MAQTPTQNSLFYPLLTPDHWDPRLVAHVLRGSPCLACHSPTSDMETNGLLSSPCDG